MRITQQMMTMTTTRSLNLRLSAYEQTQSRLATGKRILKPSDDVAGTGQSLRLRAAVVAREQEIRNAEDGQMWLNLGDSKLQSSVDQLQRVRELAVRAVNTFSPEEADAIEAEILALRDSLVGIANSKSQGRGLFSGFVSGDAVTQSGGVWSFTGDAGRITRRVSEEDVVEINVTADDVFGFNAGRDTFSVLDDLASRVASGDAAGIGTSLTEVDGAIEHLLNGLGTIGAATNRAEAAIVRNQDEVISLRGFLSSVEDVDMAEAITDLQIQEVAYQATLGALARAIQPSLVDFLT